MSAVWMISVTLALFASAPGPEAETRRRQQLEQSLGECQERFTTGFERYECTSSLLRQQSWDVALLWTQRLVILFGPPLAAGAVFTRRKIRLERLREERRHRDRLKRLDREDHVVGHRAGGSESHHVHAPQHTANGRTSVAEHPAPRPGHTPHK
ncbi:MAG: hypothetical protein IH626_14645 [Rhodospirillales bacterium]|nr:hypothetical protein [Rhodospirillales bacterium]